ncbi:Microtubule-actin cross-linking factor 1, isoforms 1/2/3/5, partial [Frankliniella fusca]
MVELGKGVFLSKTDRDQLRVDFKNKPLLLARKTLFALYGREAFQMLKVTGKGMKEGSYTIRRSVLTAVCRFVNNNVAEERAMKISDLTSMITKRAPDWRQKSPGMKKVTSARKLKQHSSKADNTSPLKTTPSTPSTPSSGRSVSPARSAAPTPSSFTSGFAQPTVWSDHGYNYSAYPPGAYQSPSGSVPGPGWGGNQAQWQQWWDSYSTDSTPHYSNCSGSAASTPTYQN